MTLFAIIIWATFSYFFVIICHYSKEWGKVFKSVFIEMKKNMLSLFFIENWILDHYGLMRVLQRFLPKSISSFQKWTKKMSKNEKGIYFSVNSITLP
jgi:hypothetical protein